MPFWSVEEAQHNFPQLIQRLCNGESFTQSKDGEEIGKLEPSKRKRPTSEQVSNRSGLLAGQAKIPDDWKEIARDDIEAYFGGL